MAADPLIAAATNFAAATSRLPASAAHTATLVPLFAILKFAIPPVDVVLKNRAQAPLHRRLTPPKLPVKQPDCKAMTIETQPQIKEVQSETKQVLRLVIHSLYSHKEIFLRELISNASDACEKLRFEAIANPGLMGADEMSVTLIPDAAAGTLTVKDNGVGMNQEEVIDNLGTIARSGTKKFLEGLSGDSAKDAQLIGQFGVGFYSSFIDPDRVTVLSKRSDSAAVRWESGGAGFYQNHDAGKDDRGTEVIMHLRDEVKGFT